MKGIKICRMCMKDRSKDQKILVQMAGEARTVVTILSSRWHESELAS